MGKIKINEIIKELINSNFDDSNLKYVFEQLKNAIKFEEAFIVFLNPESVSIKYSYPYKEEYENLVIELNDELLKELFNARTDFAMQDEEIKTILPFKNANSLLITKLLLKNTVYGAVIFASSKHNAFSQEHQESASTLASVLAYKIKDKELSDIFKVQLNALQEGYIKSKKDYKIIKEQNQKILEVDKIKSDFLANVSHELRTPLSAIIGFSEMLNTKLLGDLNPKQEEYVGDIYISGVHLLGMINEILDISKIESKAMTLNKTIFEISRAINEVVNVVLPLTLKKDIKLIKNIKETSVDADFQKIKQILYNLISNAIKFTPKNGRIEINTDFNSKFLLIEISDNGIGIAKENQEKIFDKFVQLENAYTKTESATGLGLTITKNFVDMHNGQISVESEPEKGSTFRIKIPLK